MFDAQPSKSSSLTVSQRPLDDPPTSGLRLATDLSVSSSGPQKIERLRSYRRSEARRLSRLGRQKREGRFGDGTADVEA